ncbi:hypothetical protein C3495_08615 [Clostridiaceae bacterium 14S0207]|nr:hypothetical protein C3495_08615 [Clostridiaceae bacterium 14S0207]
MKYYIKEKCFSIGDNFDILDEQGCKCFRVEGEIFTIGNKLHIYDKGGKELVFIKQVSLVFLPVYELYIGKKLLATIEKELSFFEKKFKICSNTGHYKVQGDFLAHDFSIYNRSKKVASIDKKYFSFGDRYEIWIDDNEVSYLLLLALVIVIDQIYFDN